MSNKRVVRIADYTKETNMTATAYAQEASMQTTEQQGTSNGMPVIGADTLKQYHQRALDFRQNDETLKLSRRMDIRKKNTGVISNTDGFEEIAYEFMREAYEITVELLNNN